MVLKQINTFQAIRDQGKRFLKAGVPIGGIGLQSHMHNIDVTNIKVWYNELDSVGGI